jgi:hypothetical protein
VKNPFIHLRGLLFGQSGWKSEWCCAGSGTDVQNGNSYCLVPHYSWRFPSLSAFKPFLYIHIFHRFPTFSGLPVSAKISTKVLCDPLIQSILDAFLILSFSIMASEQYSLNLDLHRAALNGNDEAVRSALREGANINALDAAGRTTIMSAVAGEQYVSFILFTSILPYNSLVGKIWTRMTRLS